MLAPPGTKGADNLVPLPTCTVSSCYPPRCGRGFHSGFGVAKPTLGNRKGRGVPTPAAPVRLGAGPGRRAIEARMPCAGQEAPDLDVARGMVILESLLGKTAEANYATSRRR